MNELAVRYTANDGSEIALDPQSIARYIITGPTGAQATEKDVARFVAVCQARKLNPLAGDCYMTVYNTQNGPQASVIVSKDYFQDQANQNPDYDGAEGGIIVESNGRIEYRKGTFYLTTENVVGGWCDVFLKSRSHPEHAEVSMQEFHTGKSLWKSKPGVMIAKVARTHALRAAFPRSFAGVYDSAEINTEPDAKPVPVQAQVQPSAAQPAPQPQPAPQQAPAPKAAPRLNTAQVGDLMELSSECAKACGQPIDVTKRAIWTGAGPWDGSEDWDLYMRRAREVAARFAEEHMVAEYDEAVPYEC